MTDVQILDTKTLSYAEGPLLTVGLSLTAGTPVWFAHVTIPPPIGELMVAVMLGKKIPEVGSWGTVAGSAEELSSDITSKFPEFEGHVSMALQSLVPADPNRVQH